jgi:hypothetical protein
LTNIAARDRTHIVSLGNKRPLLIYEQHFFILALCGVTLYSIGGSNKTFAMKMALIISFATYLQNPLDVVALRWTYFVMKSHYVTLVVALSKDGACALFFY